MFDDQDDKIRRNLFVYSSLVIAAWWLDISPIQIASSKLDFLSDVSASKVLTLTLFVQIYLLLRYKFSRVARRAGREYSVEVGRLVNSRVRNDISSRLENFRFNGRCSLFNPQLSEYVRDAENDRVVNNGVTYKMYALSSSSIVFKTSWTGDIGCNRALIDPNGSVCYSSGGNGLSFEYGTWERFVIWLRASLNVLLYTRGAVEMLLPIFLGLVSAVITSYRLFFS
jgi:hypothetical protein